MGVVHAQGRVVLSDADKMIRGTQNKVLVVDHLLQGPETTLWTAADNFCSRTNSFRREGEKINPLQTPQE
jgi:hypothetical protein